MIGMLKGKWTENFLISHCTTHLTVTGNIIQWCDAQPFGELAGMKIDNRMGEDVEHNYKYMGDT